MSITKRDFQFLRSIAKYDVLLRSQISRLHADLFEGEDAARIARKRLGVLSDLELVNQTHMRTVNPTVMAGVSAPVYYMSAKGAQYLAAETGENAFLLCNTTTPNWIYLYHFVAVSETHMMLEAACAADPGVSIAEWYGERSLADPRAEAAEKRYRLYTRLSDKLVCVPDAGFLLQKGDFAKVFYIEQDRDTTKSAERVAASKCNGFAALAEKQTHLSKHFPAATWKNFTVLMIAPTAHRRDNLRKAVVGKPGAPLWKFASLTDLKPETILTGDVWYKAGEADPSSILVKEPTS